MMLSIGLLVASGLTGMLVGALSLCHIVAVAEECTAHHYDDLLAMHGLTGATDMQVSGELQQAVQPSWTPQFLSQ